MKFTNLTCAKLGEQYKVFIDSRNEFIPTPTKETLIATIIAIKKPTYPAGFLLGWKKNETRPANAVKRFRVSAENEYLSNQNEYEYGIAVGPETFVLSKISPYLDGISCRKCTNFYKYAEPNQPDGTLICWSCRNTW